MSSRLPPLPALRLFEAAGRLLSFKLAASELGLTPSAVSHGIVGLEEALGIRLFVRGSRGLSLTAAGADYLAYVGEALSLIAVGTERLPSRPGDHSLSVSCAPLFASRWLLPRLKTFTAGWPRLRLTVDTSRSHVGFPVDGFDFAVRMSRAPTRGLSWVKLLGEELVPVCSPSYADAIAGSSGTPDLKKATLLHVTPASEGWQRWLEQNGGGGIDVENGLYFDTVDLALTAAAEGLGIAIGRRPLMDEELASGRLVQLPHKKVAAQTAYWLVSRKAEGRPCLRAFKRWLVGEARRAR